MSNFKAKMHQFDFG